MPVAVDTIGVCNHALKRRDARNVGCSCPGEGSIERGMMRFCNACQCSCYHSSTLSGSKIWVHCATCHCESAHGCHWILCTCSAPRSQCPETADARCHAAVLLQHSSACLPLSRCMGAAVDASPELVGCAVAGDAETVSEQVLPAEGAAGTLQERCSESGDADAGSE